MKTSTKVLSAAILAAISMNTNATPSRIAGGGSHMLYIGIDNNLYGMGQVQEGQIGEYGTPGVNFGEDNTQSVPVFTGISNVKTVAAKRERTMAITTSGQVYSLGAQMRDRMAIPELVLFPGEALDVSISMKAAYVLVKEGSYVIGGNLQNFGSIYRWDFSVDDHNPTFVKMEGTENTLMIASGYNHSVLLNSQGEVRTWGQNQQGQLGLGVVSSDTSYNTTISEPIFTGAQFINANKDYGVLISSTGEVFEWGRDYSGSTAPDATGNVVKINLPGRAVNVGGPHDAKMAVLETGEVYTWGWHNLIGGTMTYAYNYSTSPVQVNIPGDALAVGGSSNSSIIMDTYGQSYAWGGNGHGELGNGEYNTETHKPSLVLPAMVMGPEPAPVIVEEPVPEPEVVVDPPVEEPTYEEVTKSLVTYGYVKNGNKGHGNNEDGVDNDNPGQGQGGPNAFKTDDADDDEGIKTKGAKSWKSYAKTQKAKAEKHAQAVALYLADDRASSAGLTNRKFKR